MPTEAHQGNELYLDTGGIVAEPAFRDLEDAKPQVRIVQLEFSCVRLLGLYELKVARWHCYPGAGRLQVFERIEFNKGVRVITT